MIYSNQKEIVRGARKSGGSSVFICNYVARMREPQAWKRLVEIQKVERMMFR